jgi:hypothetical protein
MPINLVENNPESGGFMKSLFLLAALSFMATLYVGAKDPVIEFSDTLLEDVEKDIQRDEESFRAQEHRPSRAPASIEVQPIDPQKEERDQSKVKKQWQQVGPKSW